MDELSFAHHRLDEPFGGSGAVNNFLRLLGFEGVQLMYNSGAVLLGMVYNFLPFMVFPIYTSLTKLDPQLGEAAQDLGCNAWNKFVRVTAPLSRRESSAASPWCLCRR